MHKDADLIKYAAAITLGIVVIRYHEKKRWIGRYFCFSQNGWKSFERKSYHILSKRLAPEIKVETDGLYIHSEYICQIALVKVYRLLSICV